MENSGTNEKPPGANDKKDVMTEEKERREGEWRDQRISRLCAAAVGSFSSVDTITHKYTHRTHIHTYTHTLIRIRTAAADALYPV